MKSMCLNKRSPKLLKISQKILIFRELSPFRGMMGNKTYLITLVLPLFYSACASQHQVPLTQKAAYQSCGEKASTSEELLERGLCLEEQGSLVLAIQDLERAKNQASLYKQEYFDATIGLGEAYLGYARDLSLFSPDSFLLIDSLCNLAEKEFLELTFQKDITEKLEETEALKKKNQFRREIYNGEQERKRELELRAIPNFGK